jgi:DNA-binding IclR family transcriptional regulator
MSTAKLKKDALVLLVEQPMTLKELASNMGLKEKKVFNLLKGLFSAGEVTLTRDEDGQRKYRPKTPEEKAAQAKQVAANAARVEPDDAEDEDEEEEEE